MKNYITILLTVLVTAICSGATAIEKTFNEGDQVTIKLASVGGTPPFTYQWKRNGADIAGATSDTYAIPAVTVAQAGSYSIVVSNPAGSTRSEPASVIVRVAPGRGQLEFVAPVTAAPVLTVP